MDDMSNPNSQNIAPNWKQAMLVLLALFPLVMLETLYLYPYLGSYNPVFTRFLGVVIIVCSLSWIGMPITLYFNWWLNPNSVKRGYLGLFIILSLYLIEIFLFLLLL